MSFVSIPEEYCFNTRFDTYILGFCPDTDTWYATNERFFYYEYPKEFGTKEEAVSFFKKNLKMFLKIEETELFENRPSFAKGRLWLDVDENRCIEIEVNN